MAEGQSIPEPTERQKDIAAAYQSGLSRDGTLARLRCTRKELEAALAACGVPMRKPGYPYESNPKLKSPEFYEKLAAEYLTGDTIERVCIRNGCGRKSVLRALRQQGISPRHLRQSGAEPFPADVDRDAFGNWLSGFTDGEGAFLLRVKPRRKRTGGQRHGFKRQYCGVDAAASFVIGLRADDLAVLEQIHSFLACGHTYTAPGHNRRGNCKPAAHFKVYKVAELVSVVIPHFAKYPLRAKKQRYFLIWKEGVELIHHVSQRKMRTRGYNQGTFPRWTEEEIGRFMELSATLKRQREYKQPPIPIPQSPPRSVRGLFDGLD